MFCKRVTRKRKKIRYRSAITGLFVSATYARRYPHKVVGETVKKYYTPKPKPKSAWILG